MHEEESGQKGMIEKRRKGKAPDEDVICLFVAAPEADTTQLPSSRPIRRCPQSARSNPMPSVGGRCDTCLGEWPGGWEDGGMGGK